LGADRILRPVDGGEEMNLIYLITGLIALALFIYLVIALLKPEKFE
jgi:K+-transporting ATPase KdpF subunit